MADAAEVRPQRSVDARGLRCPLPLIKARGEIELIGPGEVLEVMATDPGAEHDLRAWSRRNHHRLLAVEELPGPVFRFLVQKRAD